MSFRFMILTCGVELYACGVGGADPVNGVTATQWK